MIRKVPTLQVENPEDALSTGSSHASSPEVERKDSFIRRDVKISPNVVQGEVLQQQMQNQFRHDRVGNSEYINTPIKPKETVDGHVSMYNQQKIQNIQHQQFHMHQGNQKNQYYAPLNEKPPIPPRSLPPAVPARTLNSEAPTPGIQCSDIYFLA